MMDTFIRVALALLFFLCLFDMPYGFYNLVRFSGLIGFSILAFEANKQDRKIELIIYCGLALLFQPFFKIALGREIWNTIDVLVGIVLIASILVKSKKDLT